MAFTLEDRKLTVALLGPHVARPTLTPRACRYGTLAITMLLPPLVYLFTFVCNDISGCPAPSLLNPKTLSLEKLKLEVGWPEEGIWGLGSVDATLAVLGYYLVNLLLYRFVPGPTHDGVKLSSGGKLKYKFNSKRSCAQDHTVLSLTSIPSLCVAHDHQRRAARRHDNAGR